MTLLQQQARHQCNNRQDTGAATGMTLLQQRARHYCNDRQCGREGVHAAELHHACTVDLLVATWQGSLLTAHVDSTACEQ